MSKKYKFIFCGIAFALVAIIAGLCLVFFGNKSIKGVPNSLEVKNVEGEYVLTCEYNPNYCFQFKLERFVDEEFLTIGVVTSKTNSIRLEDNNLNITPGGNYRFSARFANENGGGKGKFSKPLLWSPSWALDAISYAEVTFEEDLLSWSVVPEAESYVVVMVDENLQKEEILCEEESCDLSLLKAGRYMTYVIAKNSDRFVEDSEAGAGKQITIERKNILSNVHMSDWTLQFESAYKIAEVEIYADGRLLGKVEVSGQQDKIFTIENLESLFAEIDTNSSEIKIKTLKNDCVLESDFVVVTLP